jgi:hypothetical protein
MELRDNAAPGQSVILMEGDRLDDVPASHRQLITPAIVQAFADPPAYFRKIERACPFRSMAKWLKMLLKENRWELGLHRGHVPEWKLAGFTWYSNKVTGATITLPTTPPPDSLPADLRAFYSLVGMVEWCEFAFSGGFYSADTYRDLPLLPEDNPDMQDGPATVKAFGSNACGDELVYAADGRAGWREHETGTWHVVGTIKDTINWVFDALGRNTIPF